MDCTHMTAVFGPLWETFCCSPDSTVNSERKDNKIVIYFSFCVFKTLLHRCHHDLGNQLKRREPKELYDIVQSSPKSVSKSFSF